MAGRKKLATLKGDGPNEHQSSEKGRKCDSKRGKEVSEVKGSYMSEDCTDSDVSSDEEVIGAVGMWSSASKKGRKGKEIVYICTGGKKQCGKVIEGREKCIMCESCGGWFHTHCQELSPGAIDALESFELPWVCMACRVDLRQKRRMERKIDRCIDARMKDMEKSIREQIDESEKRLAKKFAESKQQSTIELDQKVVDELKNIETNVTKEIGRSSDSVKKVVAEQERKVDRSHNVIIHNIPESENVNSKEHDLTIVKEMIDAICGKDSGVKVEKVFRLQANSSAVNPSERQTRPRLLLVRFEKKEHADLVLKRRFGLREAGFPNKYINKDLPREQREAVRKLRQELKENGKDAFKIFRGRVVPRDGE